MGWREALGLLQKLASRRSGAGTPALAPEQALSAEIRMAAIERRIAQLEEEAGASFEVVNSIAQQHSQLGEQHAELAQAAGALLTRTRALQWACAVLALAFLGLLAAVLSR